MLYICAVKGCGIPTKHKIGALYHYSKHAITSNLCCKHATAMRRYGNVLGKQAIRQICLWCGKEFSKKRKAKYCSSVCNMKGIIYERNTR